MNKQSENSKANTQDKSELNVNANIKGDGNLNGETPYTKLPRQPIKQVNKIEKIGYKVANGVHKVAVLSIVLFITGNLFWFAKEYNNYWRARRNPSLFLDFEKINKKVDMNEVNKNTKTDH